MIKSVALAALLATGLSVGGANASTLAGTFTIYIENFNAGGSASAADGSQANYSAHLANLLGSVTYTGALNFFTGAGTTPTIGEFLSSAGGMYSDHSFDGITMSTGGFNTTTLLGIVGNFGGPRSGTVTHDDGVELYDASGLILASASPTIPIASNFSTVGGAFHLFYSAANGNPEQLNVSTVPLPAAGGLLFGALAGLRALRRRAKKA